MLHELKTWPSAFSAVLASIKTHEVRKNDRDFKVGDLLNLQEYDIGKTAYTGRFLVVEVTYITPGGTFGVPDDMVVMSIQKPITAHDV